MMMPMRIDRNACAVPVSQISPKILLVDNDTLARSSISELTAQQGWEIETFSSGGEFLAHPAIDLATCVVLDVDLPDINGLDVQRLLKQESINVPIVFTIGHADVAATVRGMKAGAVEFLLKPVRPTDFLAAIEEAIARRQSAIGDENEKREIAHRFGCLSRREKQVMTLVVTGLLNKQVGYQLGISEITVKAHRGSVMRKMKAGCFVDLVTMAAKLPMSAPAA